MCQASNQRRASASTLDSPESDAFEIVTTTSGVLYCASDCLYSELSCASSDALTRPASSSR